MPPHSPEPDRPKAKSIAPLKSLWPYIRPYTGTMLLALVALIIAAGAMLALPVALRFVIDEGIGGESTANINRWFLALLGVATVYAVFAALRIYWLNWLGERVVADMRDAVYAHILRMDPTFFEVTQTGEILSRLTTDTTLIQSIASTSLTMALRSGITFVGALVMLTITSPRLMIYIVVLVPAILLPVLVIGRWVRRLSRTAQDRVADTSGMAGETLNAIQTVQAFTLEKLQTSRYAVAVKESFEAAIRRTRIRSLLSAVAIFSLFGAITFVLWIGARSVLAGQMTGGELGQFLLYALFVSSSAASLSELWGELQRGAGAVERLMELLDTQPAIADPPDPVPMPQPGQGRIQFDDVFFAYPSRPDTPALNGFELDIRPGETIAFVGPSGAGKSTAFQLILRFYDPGGGAVRIDGVDISRAAMEDLRRRTGVVPQETVIFGATARENIRYGRPEASDQEIEAAARAAAAHDFIRELPEGYDTFLGERGTRLSGGQRQRIAIARAILKDPPILLLDEATSSLDSENERIVQAALERLMENRTTIIIAHRLATVLKADRIVVMDEGRIVDTGTHEELVRRDPLYARLAELQFGEPEDAPVAPAQAAI